MSRRSRTSSMKAWGMRPVMVPSNFQQEGDRPVVDQVHLHVGTKPATGHGLMPGREGRHQLLEQRLGLLGGRRGGKSWAQAAAGVGGQGELAHQQQSYPGLEGMVGHPPLGDDTFTDTSSAK